ncbi:MAG: hypothetical protein GXY33_17350 [Phycisphaerae bacterium]|nr:hypothetical protein [Phycisphaerae bacterium]
MKPSFYEEHPDRAFRLGDVLTGFVLCNVSMASPLGRDTRHYKYDINVVRPEYVVVLTPCCSIGDRMLTVSPLADINPTFLKNGYLGEDLTRVNREMMPEQAVPQDIWHKLPEKERQKRLQIGKGYAFVEQFVYEPHGLLPEYQLDTPKGKIRSSFYMIDFRRAYRVECDKVIGANDVPIAAKLLQVSVAVREELRRKLAKYFSRRPKEDEVQLGL